jgi:hypothetical protein
MLKLFEKKAPGAVNPVPPDAANETGDIYINSIHNEFIFINGVIEIPKIPVKELDVASAGGIINSIASFIPEFLARHEIPPKRIPPADQHFLHFTQTFRGRLVDFRHLFKIDLKFSGNPDGIIEKGNSSFYPSYRTDRIYYKSRLIPISPSSGEFSPIKIMDRGTLTSDGNIFTSTIFEDINKNKFSIEICEKLPAKTFAISPKLYPFLIYDYFTVCLNVLSPTEKNIIEAVSIFEPLFFFIYSQFKDISALAGMEEIQEHFGDFLELGQQGLVLSEAFTEKLRNYFSRFILVQDDEMAVKRWRKFEYNERNP